MKQRILYLLMAVFALAGCQEDEMQEVAFTSDMITVGPEAQTLSVEIQANCPWYIKSLSDRAYASCTYGEGSTIIEIMVMKNATYEAVEHLFTLTSENGEDVEELLIAQDARIKMEIDVDGDIPADGGYYNIYMNTNDNVQCTDYPDWITHVMSRAIQEKTFTLECKANRTGKPRYAALVFTGKNDEYVVNVKQDSYTPTSISMIVPEQLVEGLKTYSFDMEVKPMYADLTKLEITMSNKGKAWISNNQMFMEFPQYGTYTLTIFAKDKLIHQQNIEVKPIEAVLNVEDNEEICLGDFINLTNEHCSLTFSSDNMVQKQSDGSYRFVREGEMTIMATNRYSDLKKKVKVKVSQVVLNIESERVTAAGNKNRVYLVYSARGCDMKNYEFYLTDNKYPAQKLEVTNGTIKDSGIQTVFYSPAEELVDAGFANPVRQVLDRYTLHFVTTINGKQYHIKKNF